MVLKPKDGFKIGIVYKLPFTHKKPPLTFKWWNLFVL